jgi:hypothetical protein
MNDSQTACACAFAGSNQEAQVAQEDLEEQRSPHILCRVEALPEHTPLLHEDGESIQNPNPTTFWAVSSRANVPTSKKTADNLSIRKKTADNLSIRLVLSHMTPCTT